MHEQVRKVEIENEVLDTIVGVSIFRTNVEGKKEILLVQGPSGLWYFPGGKIRKGEDMKVGLRRELKEELGIDYDGSFGSFFVDSYEIKGKRLAIANVTALGPLKSEPRLQENDSIKNFAWTEDPLSFDMTEQARKIVEAKMSGLSTLPKTKRIRHPIERSPEKVPTKEEVLKIISRFAENLVFVRELSDELGIYLLEVKVEGNNPGEITEYQYIRKGEFPSRQASSDTTIYVTYYEDGMPISGYNIADLNSETGEWKI